MAKNWLSSPATSFTDCSIVPERTRLHSKGCLPAAQFFVSLFITINKPIRNEPYGVFLILQKVYQTRKMRREGWGGKMEAGFNNNRALYWTPVWINYAKVYCIVNEFRGLVDIEFFHHVAAVFPDRFIADMTPCRYLFGAQTGGN